MKITSDKVRAMIDWCHKHRLGYGTSGNYPSVFNMVLKHRRRTPNKIVYHIPTRTPVQARRDHRVYLVWQGESISKMEEACAFFIMQDRTDIVILRSPKVSNKAREIEDVYV